MSNAHPNLVFVFPDQLRAQSVGYADADPVITPRLDTFAAESRVLTHTVSTYPVCSPYRAMLMTGQFPWTNGVTGNCNTATVDDGVFLKTDAVCLPDVLKAAGYSNGYIGKWHLDPPTHDDDAYTEGPRGDGKVWDSFTPPGPNRHGFDFWYTYGCCDQHMDPHYWTGQGGIEARIDAKEWSVKHETDQALRFLRNASNERNADTPFSLFVSYNPPHPPCDQVPDEYLARYEDKAVEDLLVRPNLRLEGNGREAESRVHGYFAAITGVDEQFGRILDELDAQGLSGNTIVVFTSDHGEMLGSQGCMNKSLWYSESSRVPCVIRAPGQLAAGSDDLLWGTPDWFPTLLGLLGLTDRIPPSVQGTNYAPALWGEDASRPESVLYATTTPGEAQTGRRGVITHTHTYVLDRSGEQERRILHHDAEDPYQMENVADAEPETVAALHATLEDWMRRTGDPFEPNAR